MSLNRPDPLSPGRPDLPGAGAGHWHQARPDPHPPVTPLLPPPRPAAPRILAAAPDEPPPPRSPPFSRFMRAKAKVVEPDKVVQAPAGQAGGQDGSVGGGGVLLEDGTTVPYDWLARGAGIRSGGRIRSRQPRRFAQRHRPATQPPDPPSPALPPPLPAAQIIALGAKARAANVPGARESAIPFVTLADAERAKSALARAAAARGGAARALVVGGGYSGVELAATLRTRLVRRRRMRLDSPPRAPRPRACGRERGAAASRLTNRPLTSPLAAGPQRHHPACRAPRRHPGSRPLPPCRRAAGASVRLSSWTDPPSPPPSKKRAGRRARRAAGGGARGARPQRHPDPGEPPRGEPLARRLAAAGGLPGDRRLCRRRPPRRG